MPHQFGDPLLLDLECDVSEPISRCRQALDTIELQFNAQYEAYHHAYTDIAASLITHTLCVVKKTIGDQDYYILDLSQLNLTDGVHIALIDRDEVRQSTVIIGDVIIDANSQLTLFTDYHLALIGQNRQMSRYTLFSEGTVYLNARLEAADGIQLGAQHCILDTHAQLSSEVIHIDIAQTIEINATLLATQLQIRAGQITQKGVLEAQHIILAAQHINHTGETRAGSLIERIAWRYVADEDSCMHTPDYIRSVIMDCSESGHLSCNRYQGQFSQLSVGGRFYCGSGNTHVPDCVILADSVTNTAGSCLMLNTDLSIDANTVIDLTHGNCYTLNALRINWKQILDPTADYDQFEGYAKLALFKPANPKQGLIILSSQIYEQCYPQNKHDLFIQHTHRLKSGGDVGIGRSWHTQNANVNVYAKSTIELTNSVSNATQMGQAHLSLYAQKINVSGQLICSQTRVHMRDPSQTPDATRSQCIQYTKGGNDKSSESYQLEFALNGSFNADTLIVQGMNSYLHPNSCLTVRRAKFILKNEFRIDRARVHADGAIIKAKLNYNRFGDLYGDHLVVDAKTILNRGVIDVGNQLYFAQFFISTGVLRASHSIQTNALILLRFGYIKTPYDCVTSLLTLSATMK